MNRELFGFKIKQNSKNEFFSATDLTKAGNCWRKDNNLSDFNLALWLKNKSTVEFIEELKNKYKVNPLINNERGRNANTWVHPLLFIDLALTLSPKLKIETYEWLFDHLIKNRNESGDSYKFMCGALFVRESNKTDYPNKIMKLCYLIRKECEVSDWQTATETQLKLRDDIHKNIGLLADVLDNNKEAVRIGILKAKENQC